MKRMLISLLSVIMTALMFAGAAQPSLAAGSSPVAENLDLKTYKNCSVGGILSAFDPDGDDISFEITTNPVKGDIELNEDGSFIYTPLNNKKGRDYFGYKAIDSEGNYSQEATVIIKIEKQQKNVMYSDMDGRPEEYAAVELAEKNVFIGEQIGGNYCFYPDRPISRGEFLSMCMLLGEEPVLNSVLNTGYNDDESIPDWMKPYVATAAMCGIDNGEICDDGKIFNSTALIERTEAAEILDRIVKISPVSYICMDDSLPENTAQACANLSACGILKEGVLLKETFSRAEAAEMLFGAMELLENRNN